jgi:hypothetical protein
VAEEKPDILNYSSRRHRRLNWHAVLMVVAIIAVVVTFIAAMWGAARTFQVH